MSGTATVANVTEDDGPVLLVADHSPRRSALSRLCSLGKGHTSKLLDLSPDERVEIGSCPIQRLRIDALLDLDQLHREFLDALDRWPRETLTLGQPFDEVFRHTTGDSVWWVGPGNQRHPFGGPLFPVIRAVFLLRAACKQQQPSLIVAMTQDRRLATVLHSFCARTNRRLEFLPGSAPPRSWPGRLDRCAWMIGTTLSLLLLPLWIIIRAGFAHLMTRPRQPNEAGIPTLVMTGWYPNHVRDDETGRPRVWYWKRLTEQLKRQYPELSIRYLLHTTTFRFRGWKRFLRPVYPGWHRLRDVEEVLPLTQTHLGLRAYFRGAVRQWRFMRRYLRLEASSEFSTSFDFAGADCSCLLVGPLRSAFATVAKWSRNVSATAASLQSAGNVRVVLVHEEFYPKGMLTIAAARTLGLPTLGVQHGAIGPQHTVYMPSSGSITGAPVPDTFAAYGNFAARLLSEWGAYPRERIVIVGAPRFDELVTSSLDQATARQRLGWSHAEPVILLTTETFPLSGPIYRELIEIARTHPQWHVVVKLHPHERQPDDYQQILASSGATNVELCRDRLRERLAGCDVLVTGYSTTALEGLLMSKSVVCADFTTTPPRYPFVEAGVAQSARCPEELQAALERALQSPVNADHRRKFLQDHLGPTVDGAGAEVFATLIGERYLSLAIEANGEI